MNEKLTSTCNPYLEYYKKRKSEFKIEMENIFDPSLDDEKREEEYGAVDDEVAEVLTKQQPI